LVLQVVGSDLTAFAEELSVRIKELETSIAQFFVSIAIGNLRSWR
jgi:hypothetical protein